MVGAKILCALALAASLSAAVSEAWAVDAGNRGIDAGHSGFVVGGPGLPLVQRWARSDLSGGSGLVGGDGSVFVNAIHADKIVLLSLNPATGAMRWEAASTGGPIAAVGGRVFSGATPRFTLQSSDSTTGMAQWTDTETLFGAPTADDGLVVASALLGVRALEPATGRVLWEARDGSGSVALDGDRVYAMTGGRNDCVVRAYRRTTLLEVARQAWATPCGATAYSSQPVVAAAGRVYAQGMVLDATTGRKLLTLPSPVGLSVAPDGQTYAVSDGVIAGYAPDGSRRWRTEVPGQASSSPLLIGSTLWSMTLDGVLRAFDTATGLVRWRTATPLRGFVEMTVAGGALILAGERGVIAMADAVVRSARAMPLRLNSGRPTAAAVRVVLYRDATLRLTVYRGRQVLVRRTIRSTAGRHTVLARLSARQVRALRRASTRSLRLVLHADAADGTSETITKQMRVRR